jgi:hypothetical protein
MWLGNSVNVRTFWDIFGPSYISSVVIILQMREGKRVNKRLFIINLHTNYWDKMRKLKTKQFPIFTKFNANALIYVLEQKMVGRKGKLKKTRIL